MRHRWFQVEEDMRRDIAEPRPIIHRCRLCGVYRFTIKQYDRWRATYGKPYKAQFKRAPECRPRKGAHQWLDDVA